MLRIFAVLIVFVCSLSISGCTRSPVADDLGQKEANEIVAILREHGIEAQVEKQKGGRGRYSVQVRSKEFGESAALLSALGLPEERKPGFAELVGQSGILPSSREVEALRLDRAAAAELEELLKGLPSVVSASVVVRAYGATSGGSPSVSAVLQTRTGIAVSEKEVRELLSRTVPGLKSEEVVLSIHEQGVVAIASRLNAAKEPQGREALVPFLLLWKVPKDQYVGLASLVVALVLLVGAIAGLVGYVLGQYFLSRSTEFANSTEAPTPLDSGRDYGRLAAPQDDEDEQESQVN